VARVVILSFKDNEAAEALTRGLLKAQRDPMGGIPMELSAILVASSNVEAFLARPTASCRCKTHKNHKQAWTKTVRFGWWVHAACKRPSSLVVKNYIKNLIISGGNNLLPEIEAQLAPPADPYEVANSDRPGDSLLPMDTSQGSLGACPAHPGQYGDH
jgi:hypothetical protein